MPISAIASLIDEKYIQLGFAGFCLILVGVIIWLIKTQNKINAANNIALVNVIEKNNEALAKVCDGLNSIKDSEDQVKYSVDKLSNESKEAAKDLSEKVTELQIELKCRPCMKKENQHVG